MTETDHIRVGNLTKIRIAERIVRDVLPGTGLGITRTQHIDLVKLLAETTERMETAVDDEDKK